MHRFIQLSYGIDEATPLYPGTPALKIRRSRAIGKGDSCNTVLITLSDHSGTHIDAPKHFLDSGRGMKEYPAPKLACKGPVIIDCPKQAGEVITPGDLAGIASKKGADALLIRTGFSRYRSADAAVYCNDNPSVSPETAGWIRKSLPDLKIVGIDSISISSKAHRGAGAESHKIFLTDGGSGEGPVLILEDLYLPAGLKKLDELLVFPVFNADIDGTPCTVIGVTND